MRCSQGQGHSQLRCDGCGVYARQCTQVCRQAARRLLDLAALGICESDILQQSLFNKQGNAVEAQDVQLPFRTVRLILAEIASQLPGT